MQKKSRKKMPRSDKVGGGPITQHEEYAITGKENQDQDFGVSKHNHKNRPTTMQAQSRRAYGGFTMNSGNGSINNVSGTNAGLSFLFREYP